MPALLPLPLPRPRRRRPTRLDLLLAALALAQLGAWCGAWWWGFDLLAHFQWQYAAGALLLLAGALLLRRRRQAVVAALLLLPALLRLLPVERPAAAAAGQPVLDVVVVNLLIGNGVTPVLRDWLREVQPDVLVALELDAPAMAALDALQLPGLRRLAAQPATDSFGIGVWSRLPAAGTIEQRDLGPFGLATLRLPLQFGGTVVQLYAAHPFPPVGAEGSAARNLHLAQLGAWLAAQPGPSVVAGDFNATPWSAALRAFVAAAQLDHGTHRGWPWPTWRMGRLGRAGWLFGVPIDHVLLRGARLVEHRIGPEFGSDHRPVRVRVVLE